MINKKRFKLGVISLVIGLTTACGGGATPGTGGEGQASGDTSTTQTAKPPVSTEPVTINVLVAANQIDFQNMLIDPVKKKYPNITLNTAVVAKGNDIQDMIAAGTTPDLYTGYTGQMAGLGEMDIFSDITPLAKKMQIDLDRFEPIILDSIRASGKNNELYGLPFNVQLNATYYNRDIFDKFGIPYPKDGMTWNDAIELAKKLSRTDGGVSYRGLDFQALVRIFYPRSLNFVDPATLTPHVNNDEWKKVLQLGKDIMTIPGNIRGQSDIAINDFEKTRTLAMLTTINRLPNMVDAGKNGLNWDVAQFPSYSDLPNQYGMVDPWIMFIVKTSKHQEAAMQVLDTLTSKEAQLWMVRATARMSPLKDPQLKQELGADIPELKDKHIQSIFKSHPGKNPGFSKYYDPSLKVVDANMWDYIQGNMDLNTALRDSEEKITKIVNEGEGK